MAELIIDNISELFNISTSEHNLSILIKNVHEQQQLLPYNQYETASSLLIVLTVCYTVIFLAGILGNLVTCFVIAKNKFMHTATNFYLFNLAISDLILLLSGMPQDLYNLWYPYSYPFTDIACVIESVLCETAANATVLTVTAFTVERYIAICHPFRQQTMSKLSRAIKFIFGIWIMAFILALPQAMQFSVVSYDKSSKDCTINDDFFAHVFAISGFIFFGGPMTAICVLYLLIGIKLKQNRLEQTMPRRCYRTPRGISITQTRVIRMLIAVAVTFFLCWAPFHAQRLMAVYGSLSGIDSELFNTIFHILDYTSGVLYFLSTCINPLLYNIMSQKFRDAFKVTLEHQFTTNKYHNSSTYSVLMGHNALFRRQHTTDSIRTNTTTTTVNSSNGGANFYNEGKMYRTSRSSINMDKQSTQICATHNTRVYNRPRQPQLSQFSSNDNAKSTLELKNIEQLNNTKSTEEYLSNYVSRNSYSRTSVGSDKCYNILLKSNSYKTPFMKVARTYSQRDFVLASRIVQNKYNRTTYSKHQIRKANTIFLNQKYGIVIQTQANNKYKFPKSSKYNFLNERCQWRRKRKKKINATTIAVS